MAGDVFTPLDVNYQIDPKIIRAGHVAECLYIRGLALSKRLLSDGVIESVQLPTLCAGLPGKPSKHAAKLVEVGLWRVHSDGWEIVSWFKWNASAGAVRARSERKRMSSIRANHERWHIGDQGKPSDTCVLCYPDPIRNPSGSESGSDPSRMTLRSPQDKTEVETEVEVEVEAEAEAEAEAMSSSSLLNSHRDIHSPVDDDDDVFIAATINRIADIRTARRPNRTGSDIGYKLKVTGDLMDTERAAITAVHQRWPHMDPDHLARYYEAHPEQHPTGRTA